jgi:hypothetical protein
MVQFRTLTASAFAFVLGVNMSGCGGSATPGAPAPVMPQAYRQSALAQSAVVVPAVTTTINLNIVGSPTAIAIQKGAKGAWTALASGATSFKVTSAAYGVAYVCGSNNPQDLSAYVVQATTTDMTTVPILCADYPTGDLDATGEWAPDSFCPDSKNDYAQGGFIDDNYGAVDGCITDTREAGPLPSGTQDIFVLIQDSDLNTIGLHTQQGVTVPGSTTITFTGSDIIGPNATIKMKGAPSGATTSGFSVLFGMFDWWPIPLASASSGNTKSLAYPTVASVDVGPNDSYFAYDTATLTGPGTASRLYASELSQSPPATLTFTKAFDETVTASGSPTFTLNYTGYGTLTGGTQWYAITGDWSSAAIETIVSSNWLAKTKDYTMPNVAVSGFPTMVAPSGATYAWWSTALYSPEAYLGLLPYGQTALGYCDPLGVPNTQPVSGLNSGVIDCAEAYSSFTVPSADLR